MTSHATHPLRIAMMVSGPGINGAIVYALLLTRFLSRRGDKVLLLHRPDAWIAVLEAMSTGLPVLAANIGMLPDFVRDGVAGHIVNVGDIPAIADRLATLALEPERRKAMGAAAAKIARVEYDVEIGGPRVEAILAEAAQIRNRPLLGFVAGLCAKG